MQNNLKRRCRYGNYFCGVQSKKEPKSWGIRQLSYQNENPREQNLPTFMWQRLRYLIWMRWWVFSVLTQVRNLSISGACISIQQSSLPWVMKYSNIFKVINKKRDTLLLIWNTSCHTQCPNYVRHCVYYVYIKYHFSNYLENESRKIVV